LDLLAEITRGSSSDRSTAGSCSNVAGIVLNLSAGIAEGVALMEVLPGVAEY